MLRTQLILDGIFDRLSMAIYSWMETWIVVECMVLYIKPSSVDPDLNLSS